MKKQTKFKTFLVANILIFITACTTPINNKYTLSYFEQDTLKNYSQQVQKLNDIKQKVDSAQIKWDAIEKTLKEKQLQQPK